MRRIGWGRSGGRALIFRSRKPASAGITPFGITGTPDGRPPSKSVIGPNVTITGDLYSRGDLEIHGKVEGSITCRNLTLGEAPDVAGDITTESVRICGRFSGNLRARRVVLTSTAVVSGEIYHSSLEVAPGADIQGTVKSLSPDTFPLIDFGDEEAEEETEEPPS